MIQVEAISKIYGSHKAVDQISFEIQKNDVIGFLGPNGAGKSTTMKMLCGYMAPSSGRIIMEGLNILEHPLEIKRRIGYLPENAPLYFDMSVKDYLLYVCQLKGISVKAKALVEEVLLSCHLEEVVNQQVGFLSKGYKQRLGIAQAIVHKPEFIVLDEPTVGLDPKQVAEIRSLIQTLAKDRTILISSHILSEIQSLCNKAIIINKGKILAQDTMANLNLHFSPIHKEYDLHLVGGVIPSHLHLHKVSTDLYSMQILNGQSINSILQALLQNNVEIREVKLKKNNLEDIYLSLVEGQI